MASAEFSIVINRPLPEVFAYVTDFEHTPQWQTAVLACQKTLPGPIGVGTVFHTVGKGLGREVEGEIQITACEPNRAFRFTFQSELLSMAGDLTFAPAADGTKVTDRIDLAPRGFFKWLQPLLMWTVKRQVQHDYARVKQMLEKRGT